MTKFDIHLFFSQKNEFISVNYSMDKGTSTYQMTETQFGIIKVLVYFDLFQYPLKMEEIKRFFATNNVSFESLETAIKELERLDFVYHLNGFYTLHNQPELVERRLLGNERAKEMMKKVPFYSRLIASFPFVRCISLSGSLSKNYVEEDGDIDYFIITEVNRLWLCRTLLVLFKKIFLFNSHKYFCVNYFIDQIHLEIEEQNVYTAVEVATLLPTYNAPLFEKFQAHNPWVQSYFPNITTNTPTYIDAPLFPRLKKAIEWLFSGRLGDKLDDWLLKRTFQHWQEKFSDFDPDQFGIALKSKKHTSKHHPNNFQKRVLDAYTEKVKSWQKWTI